MLHVVSPGSRLGRYEVRSHLGGGGMGEVYLAQDTQLGRLVALKLLAAELTKNRHHLQRFEQEARAISALNHPNILTIYEIGHDDARNFIATEFVEGMTLRQRMGRAPLKVADVLETGTQVAAALAAAHAAGVVHRDIKPENVMLRHDGIVKVLDFGLAKLTEHLYRRYANTDLSTAPNVNTDPGVVMGTTPYMSPEQTRGQAVDARTDVWSLGVVLYEMCAGCVPFGGSSKSDVIVSILEREPPPLARYASATPPELERIITKALHKEQRERYQTMQDLLNDLTSLKQDLDFEVKLGRALDSGRALSSGRAINSPPGGVAFDTPAVRKQTAPGGPAENTTAFVRPAPQTTGVSHLVSEIKQHKGGALLLLLAVAAALAGLLYRQLFSSKLPAAPEQGQLTFTKLNITGNVLDAAISPDGKYVATVLEEAGKQSLRVRQAGAPNEAQLVAPAEVMYGGIRFSHDGTSIYYTALANEEESALYRVPVLGGAPRKLLSDVRTAAAESPDGRQLAFVREAPEVHGTALMVADSDGGGARPLAVRGQPESFILFGIPPAGPAWSPDGKVLACPTLSSRGQPYMNVWEVRASDGAMRQINKQSWYEVGQVAWLRDGSGLVINARENASLPFQIWLLSYPGGEVRRVTNDPNSYEVVSTTDDSATLAALQTDRLSNLWAVPDGDSGRAAQIASGKYQGLEGLAWTPDGRLLYSSNESGNDDIWLMDADGGNHRQLTFDSHKDIQPSVSKDGRFVAFVSYRSGLAHIWRMNSDGGEPVQLTDGRFEDSPQVSPDGQWVVYHSLDPAGDSIWKVPAGGGAPTLLTRTPARQPAVSPDGKLLAYFAHDERAGGAWKIAVAPLDGDAPTRFFDLSPSVNTFLNALRWTADGRALTYPLTQGGVSNIWSQPIDGGPARQLTNFKENRIFAFAWSPDGHQLVCVRGVETHDVVLIKNFR
jgi:serine/threonine protein kinase/Tol biopolymer transport system component